MTSVLYKAARRGLCILSRRRFARCGKNVIFDPISSEFSFDRISIGSHVFIGARAYFRTTHSYITIGDAVLCGPDVFILGGNHIFDRPGQLMADLEKSPEHRDGDIVIENDVWIGARVTILTGVTIHEGAIIAAGCLVNTDVGPYEIHGGVPNKKLKNRFSIEALAEHKRLLNLS